MVIRVYSPFSCFLSTLFDQLGPDSARFLCRWLVSSDPVLWCLDVNDIIAARLVESVMQDQIGAPSGCR